MLEKTMIVEEHPHVELAKLLKAVRLDPESAPEEAAEIEKMLEGALAVARPKAIYGLAQVESRDENGVTVDGVRFRSALVSRNQPHCAACFHLRRGGGGMVPPIQGRPALRILGGRHQAPAAGRHRHKT